MEGKREGQKETQRDRGTREDSLCAFLVIVIEKKRNLLDLSPKSEKSPVVLFLS